MNNDLAIACTTVGICTTARESRRACTLTSKVEIEVRLHGSGFFTGERPEQHVYYRSGSVISKPSTALGHVSLPRDVAATRQLIRSCKCGSSKGAYACRTSNVVKRDAAPTALTLYTRCDFRERRSICSAPRVFDVLGVSTTTSYTLTCIGADQVGAKRKPPHLAWN